MNLINLIADDLTLVRLNNNLYTTTEHDSLRIWKNTNSFFWYAENRGGSCVEWLMLYHNLDKENAELFVAESDEKTNILERLREPSAVNIYEPYQFSGKNIYADYFKQRNLTEETVHAFHLEYSESTQQAMIPIIDKNSKRIGIICRKVNASKENRYKIILNTLEKPVIWPQWELQTITPNSKILLFEGCWSVMRYAQVLSKIDPLLRYFCILGAFPSRKLKQYFNGIDDITFILDNDKTGTQLPAIFKKMKFDCKFILPSVYPDEQTDEQIVKVYERIAKNV